jgi:RNA polymerase sigma-70 factor (ECF subfamily)
VGLTDREIAAAFLVAEATMTKRLVRARAKVRTARISFALPDRPRLAERLAEVHAVVYLLFTEGYQASGDGPPVRAALCEEAVWLARQLHRLVPDDAETTGLLALLLLHHSRVGARVDDDGRLVPYAEQDRAAWDAGLVSEARALLATTGAAPPGPLQVQAAIALLHADAGRAEEVRWDTVAALYAVLDRLAPSPSVTAGRAVAVGRAVGTDAGLAVVEAGLRDHGSRAALHVAHADLLERAGDLAGARAAWGRAAEQTVNPVRREELRSRAGEPAARR